MRDGSFRGLALALALLGPTGCASSGSNPQNGSGGMTAPSGAGSGGRGGSPSTGGGEGGAAGGMSATGGTAGATGGQGGATASGGAGGVASSDTSPAASGGASGTPGSQDGAAAEATPPPSAGGRVLIYTHSTGFRHTSIEPVAAAMRTALMAQGFTAELSADPARFSPSALAGLRGVVLISTTGKPLGDPGSEAITALDGYVRGGGALVGIHAASSTFYEPTAAYTRLIGGRFVNHPGSVREATCYPEGSHPAAAKLPASFQTRDEIYVVDHYRDDNQVVLRCAALTGNTKLPIAWYRSEGAGRVFYSALGHNAEDFAPTSRLLLHHFMPGALWALQAPQAP